jgi:antitoxin component HigA of HigAB toxin-antitoxin module
MDKFEIDNILQIVELSDEFEFEKANALQLKLRWIVKEDESLKPLRDHLRSLIRSYEDKHWANSDSVTEEKLNENTRAEMLVSAESRFISERKELIKSKLKDYGLLQTDLAKILGHRNNYMSELINGIRPFSKDDIVIIHRLLKIKLDKLISPFVKEDVARHVRVTLQGLKKSKVKLSKKDLDFIQI